MSCRGGGSFATLAVYLQPPRLPRLAALASHTMILARPSNFSYDRLTPSFAALFPQRERSTVFRSRDRDGSITPAHLILVTRRSRSSSSPMLSLKAVHDSRRTRTVALPPSARLHYNLSRTPVVGTSIGSSARLNGAVILAGGTATMGRARPQRNTATTPVVGQGKVKDSEDSTHAGRIAQDKQRELTTAQATASNEDALGATKAAEEDFQPATADPPTHDAFETANSPPPPPPPRTLRRASRLSPSLPSPTDSLCYAGADSHDFEIVPLAPTLAETVLLPLPSPALDEDEWEILAAHDDTNCS